ncbi:hypothetical protein HPP92_024352 [Vanilla planifolia]|uniref:Uncharacterized protein n=1 Tax=Vanilla planifolia TaxID=51239 RepID=A0A835UB92_VANPL|nr:hypothetical protein HPP92_024352 [Vanilla planifolia]
MDQGLSWADQWDYNNDPPPPRSSEDGKKKGKGEGKGTGSSIIKKWLRGFRSKKSEEK